ncbi:PSMC3 [Symbiodinium sp. CCMP2592]|nr:PSMC3 [Symbiodinium sp. CCMP2592]
MALDSAELLFEGLEGDVKAILSDGASVYVSSSVPGFQRVVRLRFRDGQRRGALLFDGLSINCATDDGHADALILQGGKVYSGHSMEKISQIEAPLFRDSGVYFIQVPVTLP